MEKILSPLEINKLTQQIISSDALQTLPDLDKAALEQLFEKFTSRWQTIYSRFGENLAGELAYRDNLLFFTEQILPKLQQTLSKNGADKQAVFAIESMLSCHPSAHARPKRLPHNWRQQRQSLPEQFDCPEFDRPLFIVSAPRSGSTLLFETLSRFEELWSIGEESHDIETDIPYLHPASHDFHSNRLTDAPAEIASEVTRWFTKQLQDRNKQLYLKLPNPPHSIRFLEKTPKNALRIPFLKKVFPTAQFIFLYRNPVENISSLLEGWRSKRFLAYTDMPGWPYKEWRFLLPPGWENLAERPLAEIAAYQWRVANQTILDDLRAMPQNDWCFVSYQNLVQQPKQTIEKVSVFAGLRWNEKIEQLCSKPLPFSSMVISSPVNDKWRRHEAEIMSALPMTESVVQQIRLLE